MCSVCFALWMTTSACWADDNVLQKARPPIELEKLEELARRIEPDLRGQVTRAKQYIEFFRQQLANDTRLFAFQVKAKVDADDRVRLDGYVEFPETRDALLGYLKTMSLSVDASNIRTLPSASLGATRLGFVKVPHRFSTSGPGRGETVTECLYAEPVYLLDEVDSHLLVHSQDGYLGFLPSSDVQRVTASEFEDYLSGPRANVQSDCRTESGLSLQAGTQLTWIEETDQTIFVALLDGSHVSLPKSRCQKAADRSETIEQVLRNALALQGTRYQWGGKTSDGIDCSGLVQTAFQSVGVYLPRDSNQQFLMGRLTATRWHTAGLRRGDTMYFIGAHGRIRHTGIYLGNDQYLEAVSPVAKITSLNPRDSNYDARRHASFVFAKRLF
ncbi:MAG: C40 family peptidase [Planctomycetota bacterium]|nr:C40 family peptidase [Planctomycetota bacterium]